MSKSQPEKPTVPPTLRGYPVKRRCFTFADNKLELLGPANFEALIDDPRTAQRFAEDEYLPYWAEFWPACELFARRIADWPVPSPGRSPRVLELGCGLGLPGLVALQRGYDVIISDYDEDALAFVHASAEHNRLRPPRTRFVDWREIYPDLQLDRIIAAEVTYERRSLAPIARFLREHLALDGAALICDRNRQTADTFPEECRAAGLRVAVERLQGVVSDGSEVAARLFTITLR